MGKKQCGARWSFMICFELMFTLQYERSTKHFEEMIFKRNRCSVIKLQISTTKTNRQSKSRNYSVSLSLFLCMCVCYVWNSFAFENQHKQNRDFFLLFFSFYFYIHLLVNPLFWTFFPFYITIVGLAFCLDRRKWWEFLCDKRKISISQAFSLLPFFACLIQLIYIYVVIFNTGGNTEMQTQNMWKSELEMIFESAVKIDCVWFSMWIIKGEECTIYCHRNGKP